MHEKTYKTEALFGKLPNSREDDFDEAILESKTQKFDAVIVLDDDPTGTQTVYGVPVLTDWKEESIKIELEKGTSMFFILTNSRALKEQKAEALAFEIGKKVVRLSQETGKKCLIISRGDSTLRGHYPAEFDALGNGLGNTNFVHFLIPAFFEGGRYTIGDVHYVKTKDKMIPAAQTEFARDVTFAYHFSDLKFYVEEKTKNAVPAKSIKSVTIEDLRKGTLKELISKLDQLEPGATCIVNAANYQDLKFFTLALLKSNVNPLLRTSASFVAAIFALPPKPLLSQSELLASGDLGGLIVVGSYVPRTSQQLDHLRQHSENISYIEVDVRALLKVNETDYCIEEYSRKIDQAIGSGKNAIVYTSRALIKSKSPEKNLDIGKKISDFLTDIISGIRVQPKYIITKGGITSSDIATKSMGVKRAIVLGQVISGVPVWKLGIESKFPGISYIIFPGNVGTESALTEVVEQLKT